MLYVINPTSLAKPHALEQLQADVISNGIDVVLVSETWFKSHHLDSSIGINGYNIFRKDRKKRRGGGVAIYIRKSAYSEIFTPQINSHDSDAFELLWVKAKLLSSTLFIGVIYHPPNPSYHSADLIQLLSLTLDYISNNFDNSTVILAGDFNQLADDDMCALGLLSIVQQPTHMGHNLDRIYVTQPIYSGVKVVASNIKTSHNAVIARPDSLFIVDLNKKHESHEIRTHTPSQAANLFSQLKDFNWYSLYDIDDVQLAFDKFYQVVYYFLDLCFPIRIVTTTSRDPTFMTPAIKLMLRQKNRFMHRGLTEKAAALSLKIGAAIIAQNTRSFENPETISNSASLWAKVNAITGKTRSALVTDGIDASSLNAHYASISQDPNLSMPNLKPLTAAPTLDISPFYVMKALEGLKRTSPGLDNIPVWFLKLSAPFISEPIAYLFSLSLKHNVIPAQWKTAVITPVPKVPQPKFLSDFRPISLTPILSRILEKAVVKRIFYPLFSQPNNAPILADQFAFRPTGSTTAAIITILHQISSLLLDNDYTHVIALDFSKAFDTVQHGTLLHKMDTMGLPDSMLNWVSNFFLGRGHITKYAKAISDRESISASVIQGSALGPSCFIIYASDLKATTPGNIILKYADDSYLFVPSRNSGTITLEMNHIATWALNNGLKLNSAKTQELLVTRKNFSRSLVPIPLPNITRVATLKVLGILIHQDLSFSAHVNAILSKGGQNLYAIRTLKAHGLSGQHLYNVCRATFIAGILYASPAWWGYTTMEDRQRLQSLINKALKWNLYGGSEKDTSIEYLCKQADEGLFTQILCNTEHILHPLLPPIKKTNYTLRNRNHNRQLPTQSTSANRNFIHRMLYTNSY